MSANLTVKERMELAKKTLTIKLEDYGFDNVTYKPLSGGVITEYQKTQKKVDDVTIKEMAKKLNLNDLNLDLESGNIDKDEIIKTFLSKFSMEELIDSVADQNISHDFIFNIEGMPEKDKLINKIAELFEADTNDFVVMNEYNLIMESAVSEFVEVYSQFTKKVAPNTPSV